MSKLKLKQLDTFDYAPVVPEGAQAVVIIYAPDKEIVQRVIIDSHCAGSFVILPDLGVCKMQYTPVSEEFLTLKDTSTITGFTTFDPKEVYDIFQDIMEICTRRDVLVAADLPSYLRP